mmetsp:Transcript_20066/g.58680  ORF Transcript_20066/g.58680 Transcript_20066/m.58680 type:complete len:220 (+) Transcript_20066:1217-1876(+)
MRSKSASSRCTRASIVDTTARPDPEDGGEPWWAKRSTISFRLRRTVSTSARDRSARDTACCRSCFGNAADRVSAAIECRPPASLSGGPRAGRSWRSMAASFLDHSASYWAAKTARHLVMTAAATHFASSSDSGQPRRSSTSPTRRSASSPLPPARYWPSSSWKHAFHSISTLALPLTTRSSMLLHPSSSSRTARVTRSWSTMVRASIKCACATTAVALS